MQAKGGISYLDEVALCWRKAYRSKWCTTIPLYGNTGQLRFSYLTKTKR